MIPRLSIGQSELWAVPAMHYRAIFAEQVNRVCRDSATRPDAVAVELSHDAVVAVSAWLQELGVGPGCAGHIPCMLGWVKTNHRIHPRHLPAALRLQEMHGLALHQIPASILRQELHYSSVGLLALSTTDSMIEAIRSALEFELPVYGIDLGNTAAGERGHPLLQEPILAQGDLASYVARNAPLSCRHRDPVVDDRREQVMAARLKRLLREYRRVLFTGGLGHWQPLCQRLRDPRLRAALAPSHSEQEQFTRVVVAPALAIQQMDLFPDLTTRYEAIRQLPPQAKERWMDYAAFCRDKLTAACESAGPKHRNAVAAWVQYLANLCLLHQHRVPDLFTSLAAARAMLSPAFARHLSELFVWRAVDWARPEQWSHLPYLRESRARGGHRPLPGSGQCAELRHQDRRSPEFYLTSVSGGGDPLAGWFVPLGLEAADDSAGQPDGSRQASSWVWPPCETLLYSTAYSAAETAERNPQAHRPEPFAGSLEDGVDVKATLRSLVRGQRRIHVRVPSSTTQASGSTGGEEDPTVFIFEREETVKNGRWDMLLAAGCEDLRCRVRDRARFDQVLAERGDAFVANVHFCTNRKPRAALRPHVRELRYLYGIVLFGNPALNPLQSARWLEASDYSRCPILPSSLMGSLFEHYRRAHRLVLDQARWVAGLMLLALPYARHQVLVVLPTPMNIPNDVRREAAARRIRLETLPLATFSPARLEAIRHQYIVMPGALSDQDYSDEVRAAFGEPPEQHLELLPERIRAQLDPEA